MLMLGVKNIENGFDGITAYIPLPCKIPQVGGSRLAISQHVGILEPTRTLKFELPPTRNIKCALPPTQNLNARRWNIGCIGSPGIGSSRWACTFHIFVLISFAFHFFVEYGQ